MTEKLTPKTFMFKILNGTAIGTIVSLIPYSVLYSILQYVSGNVLVDTIIEALVIFQYSTPFIIGGLIALEFKFNPMKTMIVGGASMVGAGLIQFNETIGHHVVFSIGDVINTMLTAAIAVGMLLLIKDRLGSVAIIALPIIVGIGAGVIGMFTYPYVTMITQLIGNMINTFTELQPMLMSILITCTFAILIISPITTVGIGVAIQMTGMAAGAAAMGVGVTCIVLVVNSWKVNKPGITLAVALGGMKIMMPNLFKTPIILLPILVTSVVSAIPVALYSISGTPTTAGFGITGLIGPIASFDQGLGIIQVLLFWFVIPIVVSIASQILFEKVLKIYDRCAVFGFHPAQ